MGRTSNVALLTFKPFTLTVKMDEEVQLFHNVWFATVSNHPYFGGGMKISPSSEVTASLLELKVVHNLSKLKFALMFGSVFFGAHTRFKEVKQFTREDFEWQVDCALPCHTDGEYFILQQPNVQIQVVPASLKVAKS